MLVIMLKFGDIVLKQVANEPVVQSPLDNWCSLMPSDFLLFGLRTLQISTKVILYK